MQRFRSGLVFKAHRLCESLNSRLIWKCPASRPAASSLRRRDRVSNYFTAMCSGFEAGSYLRLIDVVYHATLGLRVTKREREDRVSVGRE